MILGVDYTYNTAMYANLKYNQRHVGEEINIPARALYLSGMNLNLTDLVLYYKGDIT
jgi:hypothetical protein